VARFLAGASVSVLDFDDEELPEEAELLPEAAAELLPEAAAANADVHNAAASRHEINNPVRNLFIIIPSVYISGIHCKNPAFAV